MCALGCMKYPCWVKLKRMLEFSRRCYDMTGTEALQSVQYITVKGKRLAVLSAEDWEALIEWIETLEDVDIAKQSLAELKSAGGDRKSAGWLEWRDVEENALHMTMEI